MAHMCHRGRQVRPQRGLYGSHVSKGGASQTSERTIWLTCVKGGGKSDLREDYMAHMCHRGRQVRPQRGLYGSHVSWGEASQTSERTIWLTCVIGGGKSDLREVYMAHMCHRGGGGGGGQVSPQRGLYGSHVS